MKVVFVKYGGSKCKILSPDVWRLGGANVGKNAKLTRKRWGRDGKRKEGILCLCYVPC